MEIYLVPKFCLIVFAFIQLSVSSSRSGAGLAGTESDKNEDSNLLLVEKKDGLKSLIKIEERTEGIFKTAEDFYVRLE